MTLSIDISNNNGDVNLTDVLHAHPELRVLGLKVTEGRSFHDSTFAAHFDAAEKLGLVVLPYHFARPDANPGIIGGRAEADFFLADLTRVRHRRAFGRPVLDYESAVDVSFAVAFVRRIEQELGVKPLIYCSGSRVPEIASSGILTACPLWVAAYGSSLSYVQDHYVRPYGVRLWMWQYTDNFDGRFDASEVYVDVAKLRVNPVHDVLVISHDGKKRMLTYGSGRVKKFMQHGLGRLLKAGKRVTLRRRAG